MKIEIGESYYSRINKTTLEWRGLPYLRISASGAEFLSAWEYMSKDLWREVKLTVRQIESRLIESGYVGIWRQLFRLARQTMDQSNPASLSRASNLAGWVNIISSEIKMRCKNLIGHDSAKQGNREIYE